MMVFMSNLSKNIQILHEDGDFLVINKPSGLVVHPDGRTTEPTLTDWILEKYPEIKSVGEPLVLSDGRVIDRPGIVHRIDRDTSGVLVIVKNQKAFLHLKEQFKNNEVSKTYLCFVYGKIKLPVSSDYGEIDRPIGKSKSDFRLWSAQRGAKGAMREAKTIYKVLKQTPDWSYLEVSPKTGRTHQIRVHMKAVNHPVLCDKLYAPKRECLLGFERTALLAMINSFRNLVGEMLSFEAPVPEDFQKAEKVIGANTRVL